VDRRGKIQQLIRRYINSILVRQTSSGEPIPLREIALAEYFHTTRTTVQAACRDLIAEGRLIRIPGRRGLFVNTDSPACRGPGVDFRILCDDGREQFFDFSAQCIVNGFCRSFPDHFSGCCYAGLLSSEPDQAAQELMEIPCYAYLWIRPEPSLFPVAEKLIESGFPVVMVASYYDFNVRVPASNAILFDFEEFGRDRAEWIHRNHFKRPLIYSNGAEMIRALSRKLESYGEKLDPESVVWLPTAGEIREKLPGIIRRFKPDCLVADGRIFRIFQTFSSFISDVPELRHIPIYLENAPAAVRFREQHPELTIHLPAIKWSDPMFRIGACAAEIMRGLLKNPGRFPNRRISDFQAADKNSDIHSKV
jgi:hypothetical protein